LEKVRGKGLQRRTTPDGWEYNSPGGMTPQQVKDLVPKDILLFNWFWAKEDGGEANEKQDERGFRQVYGNRFRVGKPTLGQSDPRSPAKGVDGFPRRRGGVR
jgi:hypothetical protein